VVQARNHIKARKQGNSRKAKADTPEYAEVKQRMVDAAIELMAEKGLAKFRFEELAERVGYNRATIYRYFDSKQDLVTEVMMRLMHQITDDVIEKTAGSEEVTRESFTEALYNIIQSLRNDRRYAIVMDAQNIEIFANLTHEYFSAITTSMLEKHMTDNPAGRVLKDGVDMEDAVHWLMHQIISYGFLGLKGDNELQQKAYLEKMVVSVII
jgi:AcrR family transcriptional regulator